MFETKQETATPPEPLPRMRSAGDEGHLEQLLAMLPAGIYACGMDGRLTFFNRRAVEIWRFEPQPGLNYATLAEKLKILGPDGAALPVHERPIALALRTGQSVRNAEAEMERPDGSRLTASFSVSPTYDAAGRPSGAIVVFQDITAEKRARATFHETEERFHAVFDQAAVGIIECDLTGRIVQVNPAFCRIVGFGEDELRRMTWGELTHPEERHSDARLIARLFRCKIDSLHVERRYVRKDGSFGWVDVFATMIMGPAGQPISGLGVVVDVNERKRAEMELERARDEAVGASRAKDDFLAALSHELRTPLSPVLLLASEAAADPKLPVAIRADFETIRKSVELEARLIDDLLDLTRITRNKLALDLRSVDLLAVLRDALATVDVEFKAKLITVVTDFNAEPHLVWGDPVRLQQVFWNILSNAVKFTPPGGTVTIATRLNRPRRELEVAVTDTGIGITARELERAFEAFAQGEHATPGGSHQFGGLGLGLAITRRIVELHRGRIEAESAGRNRGATFRVVLPVHRPVAVAAPAGGGAEAPGGVPTVPTVDAVSAAAGRILLVEDHAPTRATLEHLLVRRHYEVHSVASAAEARVCAEQGRFDLLISDIGLPDGSGYDLMREFRRDYDLKGIALTGYGMEDDISRSLRAGFTAHLTKPVRMQTLDKALAVIGGRTNAK